MRVEARMHRLWNSIVTLNKMKMHGCRTQPPGPRKDIQILTVNLLTNESSPAHPSIPKNQQYFFLKKINKFERDVQIILERAKKTNQNGNIKFPMKEIQEEC